jgi:hypothetical protein
VPSPRKRSGVEEISLDAQAPAPSAPSVPSAAAPMRRPIGGGYVELDPGDDDAAASGLQTVSYLPPEPSQPRVAPAPASRAAVVAPARPRRDEAAVDPQSFLNAVSLGIIVLGIGGLLTWVNPMPGGWSVMKWLAGTDKWMLGALAVALLVAAGAVGASGTRRASWGHYICGAGLLATAGLLGLAAFAESAAASIVPQAMPFASALAPFGLGVWGVTRAWTEFRNPIFSRKTVGFVLAVIAAVGFSAAIQLVRG